MANQGEGELAAQVTAGESMLAWLIRSTARMAGLIVCMPSPVRMGFNSVKLEELWVSLGEEASAEKMVGAHAGKVLAEEVAEALGFSSRLSGWSARRSKSPKYASQHGRALFPSATPP